MKVKAVTAVSKKMDAVIVKIFIYSSADTLKETIEDNLKKTNAMREFMDRNTPHEKGIDVTFGKPFKKMVMTVNKTNGNPFGGFEQTERQYKGYEMRSEIFTEISLSKECKFDEIYSESLKYDDCTVNIEYIISAEALAEVHKELRQKLIAEANKQMSELTDMKFEMIDFSYHCGIDDLRGRRYDSDMMNDCASFGAQKNIAAPADKEMYAEYATMINSIYNKDMAPITQFSDEIIVEYICKNAK